jgi:hypothetical protein
MTDTSLLNLLIDPNDVALGNNDPLHYSPYMNDLELFQLGKQILGIFLSSAVIFKAKHPNLTIYRYSFTQHRMFEKRWI